VASLRFPLTGVFRSGPWGRHHHVELILRPYFPSKRRALVQHPAPFFGPVLGYLHLPSGDHDPCAHQTHRYERQVWLGRRGGEPRPCGENDGFEAQLDAPPPLGPAIECPADLVVVVLDVRRIHSISPVRVKVCGTTLRGDAGHSRPHAAPSPADAENQRPATM